MRSCRHPLFLIVLMVLLVALAPQHQAKAQAHPDTRAAYLRALGLDEQAFDLEVTLLEALQTNAPALLPGQQERMASFFAFIMTLSGVTAEKAKRLHAGGVDIVHAITAGTRPLMEQALHADLVLVGTVIDLEESDELGDGFRSSITVRIDQRLKGIAPSDTVIIRQRSGLAEAGTGNHERDLKAEQGATYLLLLSNGMYRFNAAVQAERVPAPIPEATQARHFLIYRWYRMEENRLLWRGFNRRDTEQALGDLRRLDEWMEVL